MAQVEDRLAVIKLHWQLTGEITDEDRQYIMELMEAFQRLMTPILEIMVEFAQQVIDCWNDWFNNLPPEVAEAILAKVYDPNNEGLT